MSRCLLFIGIVLVLAVSFVYVTRSTATDPIVLLPSSKDDVTEVEPPSQLLPELEALTAKLRDRGARTTRLRVLRVVLDDRSPSEWCGPWEAEHRGAAAADVLVEDWNGDRQVSLDDVLLLARAHDDAKHTSPTPRGTFALFASPLHQPVVHLDTSGFNEYWAELHDRDGSVQFAKWREGGPTLKSLHGHNAPSKALKLVIDKKPSLFYLAPGSNDFQLLPCVLVCADDRPLKVYPAALGFAPEGDKEQQGDGRTPEGEFRLCEKNPKSQFYKSLRLSYPEQRHADVGLNAGLISKPDHALILRALRRRRIPPQNTALGGDIMIHGGGVGSNWTLGCVAMRNEDLDELFETLSLGTRVTVRPAQ